MMVPFSGRLLRRHGAAKEQSALDFVADAAHRFDQVLSLIHISTELLGYSRFVLFKHKDRFTIDSADSNALFFGVRQDLTKLSLAAYLCELCADTAPAGEPAKEQQRLLLNCLHLLETGKRSAEFIKPLYELRQISLSGYMPDLVACRECGQYERPLFHFYPVSGELVCAGCDTAPKAGQYVELSPDVYKRQAKIKSALSRSDI